MISFDELIKIKLFNLRLNIWIRLIDLCNRIGNLSQLRKKLDLISN